jgi:hypothetical protein
MICIKILFLLTILANLRKRALNSLARNKGKNVKIDVYFWLEMNNKKKRKNDEYQYKIYSILHTKDFKTKD